jgi:uncharacterized delta-60 repeat protein
MCKKTFNPKQISKSKNLIQKNNFSITNSMKGNLTMFKKKNSFNNFSSITKSILVLFMFLLNYTFTSVYAQATASQMWAARYNGSAMGYDNAYSVCTDPAGNVYVTGSSDGGGATHLDICTIKYTPAGLPSPTWPDVGFGVGVRRFDGPMHDFDEGHNVAVDPAGNVYVTGYANFGGLTGINYVTIKYSPSGSVLWIAVYDGGVGSAAIGIDYPLSMYVDAAGNVYVTGESGGIGTMYDCATVKYSPSGVLLWANRINGPASKDDAGMSVKGDAAGNVYVAGYSDFGAPEAINFIAVKYSPSGTALWFNHYNDETVMNNDYGYDLALDASGNMYETGVTVANGNKSYSTVKYSPAGTLVWAKKFDGPGFDDIPAAIAVDPSGNVVVTGKSDEAGVHDFAYATIKYSPAGTVLWTARYVGPGLDDEPSAMAVDKFGNIYVTGFSHNPSTAVDYVTIRYSPSGVMDWLMSYDNVSMHDKANAIALDSMGSVIVTRLSTNGPGGPIAYDYATVKYTQTVTGIISGNNETPDNFSLSQNYPNPFNPSTNIGFKISKAGLVTLKVYDINGKEIEELVNQQMNPGSYEVKWNASKYPAAFISQADYRWFHRREENDIGKITTTLTIHNT